MANINKITGISTDAINKVRGLAKSVLLKAKGALFVSAVQESTDYPSLPTSNSITIDIDGVMHIPENNSAVATMSTSTLYGDTIPTFTAKISYSVWFKYDTSSSSNKSYYLFDAGTTAHQGIQVNSNDYLRLYKFASNGGNLTADLTQNLSTEAGIDLFDGEWHHLYVGYSEDQSMTMADGASEYHIVIDGAHEVTGVALDNYANSQGLPVSRTLGVADIRFGSNSSGGGHYIHGFESLVDQTLTFKQVQWLYNSGNGRGSRSMSQAYSQSVNDIPSSTPYLKTSLRTASGIDTSNLQSSDPIGYEGSLEVKNPAFIPMMKFGFAEKAYSFWAKIDETNTVVLDITQGAEANDSIWHQLTINYNSSNQLEVEFDRRRELFGRTSQYAGQQTIATIDFSSVSLIDNSYHHFLISLDSDGSAGNMRTFVDGDLVDTTSYSSTMQNMRIDEQDDTTLTLNYEAKITDVEVYLGEFTETFASSLHSGGPGFTTEPEWNNWGSFASTYLNRYGDQGLDLNLPGTTSNYAASYNKDITVPSGLSTGDYFHVTASTMLLGYNNGWMYFYDPTVGSRTGTGHVVDSSSNYSWLFAFRNYVYSPYSPDFLRLDIVGTNSTSVLDVWTSSQISSNVSTNSSAYHMHIRDHEFRFTKEAAGTWSISVVSTSRYDNSTETLNGPTGVTLPSIMRVDVKGRQSSRGNTSGLIEIVDMVMSPTIVQ